MPAGGRIDAESDTVYFNDAGVCRESIQKGYNDQGNFYKRHADGAYHYDNRDGLTYDYDPHGDATYISPSGYVCAYPQDVDDGDFSDNGGCAYESYSDDDG